MADILRVVELSTGGRPSTVLDLEQVDLPGGVILKERDSFQVNPPAKRPRQVQYSQRFGGQRTVGEAHDNGAIAATWAVKGASADLALQNAEQLLDTIDDAVLQRQRYIQFRPDGATRDALYEIRGPGTWTPKYQWARFSQVDALSIEASWPVAPYALGLPLDIYDDFSVDSIGDYTFDQGARSQSRAER
jgi:hypothetical protein